jgi:hypothetical protein
MFEVLDQRRSLTGNQKRIVAALFIAWQGFATPA